MAGAITDKRVVVATLFLPYTVDFHVKEKKKRIVTTPATADTPTVIPNLLQSLAKHQLKEDEQTKDELFDFTQPEQLVQPRSKQQREEEIRKLTPLLSVIPSQSRRPSLDSAQVFADAPWSVKPCSSGNIGLNNALFSIQDQLNNLAWVGTLGMPTDPLSKKTRDEIHATFTDKHNAYPVMPSDSVFDGHYNLYCKQVLWPYFHYIVQDDPQNMMSQDGPYKAYQELNKQFADTIIENYKEGDISKYSVYLFKSKYSIMVIIVWINDYHLMLVPGLIREKIPNATIGFFLHIPFPSSELFRCLPRNDKHLSLHQLVMTNFDYFLFYIYIYSSKAIIRSHVTIGCYWLSDLFLCSPFSSNVCTYSFRRCNTLGYSIRHTLLFGWYPSNRH